MSGRVFIIDPALRDEQGHYLNYAESLARTLRASGAEVVVVGNLHLSNPVRDSLSAHPLFTYGHPGQDASAPASNQRPASPIATRRHRRLIKAVPSRAVRRWLRSWLKQRFDNRVAEYDLRQLLGQFQVNPKDLLLMNSLNQRHLPGFVQALRASKSGEMPTTVFILHFSLSNPHVMSAYERRCICGALSKLGRSEVRKKAILVADSEELAEEYSAATALPVSVVPIPHCSIFARSESRDRQMPFQIAYLGVGTRVKGFHLLPGIVRNLLPEIRQGMIEFQIHAQIVDMSPVVDEALRALQELPVVLHFGTLAPSEYRRIMLGSDILIEPFDRQYYKAQTSGVFSEARAAGLVSIVPSGTVMASEVRRAGGGVVVSTNEPNAFAEAIRSCIQDFTRMALEAEQRAQEWRRLHSPDAFVAALQNIGHPELTNFL